MRSSEAINKIQNDFLNNANTIIITNDLENFTQRPERPVKNDKISSFSSVATILSLAFAAIALGFAGGAWFVDYQVKVEVNSKMESFVEENSKNRALLEIQLGKLQNKLDSQKDIIDDVINKNTDLEARLIRLTK